ncbi:hypothetical protein KR222_007456 [Zaprionus bogoriensis]|nr:hypothetical protein KR222_007456 [Zaprionus bogoriensis]
MAVSYLLRKPRTLYECISLICRMQFVVCCNGFFQRHGRFVLNRWTRLYSLCCAIVAVLSLYACLFALLLNAGLRERVLRLDKLVLSIMGLELVISTLVFLITVISLQFYALQHSCIFERLAEIDGRMMREFGVNLNYSKLMRKNLLVLSIVGVIYICAVNTALVSGTQGRQLELVLPAALCYILITSGPHLTGYVHMTLSEILTIRFRLLQQLLNPQFLQRRFGRAGLCERRLRSLAEIVTELHYIIQEINKVYSLSSWSAMAHDFTLSTSELYIIFGRSMGGDAISGVGENHETGISLMLLGFLSLCMMLPFYKMLIAPVYCSHSVDEGRKCLRLLEQLDNWFPHSASVKQLVESMMRWRLQFRVEFMSGLSIVMNKTVIAMYASIVFNYLLVLIQFAMTQKLGEQVEQQKIALQEWIGI